MANTSSYLPGNRFERVQAPPYFMANNRPFWPSLAWSASITLAAADPLHITRPIVQPEMVPISFFPGETDGLLIDSISVRYTGKQNSVNALFIYELFNFNYYCVGSISLPVHPGSQNLNSSSTLGSLKMRAFIDIESPQENARLGAIKMDARINYQGISATDPLYPQPQYLQDTTGEPLVDSFGQPVTITSVLSQGDPGTMPNPTVLLGKGTLKYAMRLMESESIFLGIAQTLTTPIVVSACGQRYSKLERISASLGTT